MAYLYGASIQGIQEFIFATNKLQEIVGASEIIKNINKKFEDSYKDSIKILLLNVAGNIKVVFDSKEECQKVVKEFPKEIIKEAYGITISQAVVEFDDNKPEKHIKKLEEKLKIQRNKPSIALDMSINILQLNPTTAKPVVYIEKKGQNDIILDKASKQKRDNFPKDDRYKELKDLSNKKNKLTVIHADGNGLGKIVPQLGDRLSQFSIKLDLATKQAFKDAKTDDMKIREVILGGDDMTVICDANDALTFTQKYLENFEKNTSKIEELKGLTDKLTACAGIAYCNEKYPFHYAVSLAEDLCGEAKNHSNREASCVMFHNIQSANYQTWSKFVEDELTITNDKEVIKCNFGPYYLNKNDEPKISDFINSIKAYSCEESPISRLRSWLSELGKSHTYSKNLLKRINDMAKQSSDWNSCIMDNNLKNFNKELSNENLIIEKDNQKKTPIYDILQILSVTEARS